MNHNTYNNNNDNNNPSSTTTTTNNQGQERYRVGWEDGCADVNSHSDTHERLNSHTNYEHHSYDYMKGYDHGLADCISQDSYNTVDMNHNTYNNNNDNNNPSSTTTTTNNQGQANTTTTTNPTTTTTNNQGQANNQRVFCVVAVGTCNVTSGQAQNLNNN
jgi:SWI/SNF chromatin-remodeling complex subunit SWI1